MGPIEDDIDTQLAIPPILNHIIATEAHQEFGAGTTVVQFRVLSVAQSYTLSSLACERRISSQALGKQIQVMIERGGIARASNPRNRHQQIFCLTVTAYPHYAQVHLRPHQRIKIIVATLNDAEQAHHPHCASSALASIMGSRGA